MEERNEGCISCELLKIWNRYRDASRKRFITRDWNTEKRKDMRSEEGAEK
jgi:hypothetical protein